VFVVGFEKDLGNAGPLSFGFAGEGKKKRKKGGSRRPCRALSGSAFSATILMPAQEVRWSFPLDHEKKIEGVYILIRKKAAATRSIKRGWKSTGEKREKKTGKSCPPLSRNEKSQSPNPIYALDRCGGGRGKRKRLWGSRAGRNARIKRKGHSSRRGNFRGGRRAGHLRSSGRGEKREKGVVRK